MTHFQWIYRYRCILIHDRFTGTLVLAHKEGLIKEIVHQLEMGAEGLAEDDRILLECNLTVLPRKKSDSDDNIAKKMKRC